MHIDQIRYLIIYNNGFLPQRSSENGYELPAALIRHFKFANILYPSPYSELLSQLSPSGIEI
jgi:hypothetical protein